jgi:hypothetical protein
LFKDEDETKQDDKEKEKQTKIGRDKDRLIFEKNSDI